MYRGLGRGPLALALALILALSGLGIAANHAASTSSGARTDEATVSSLSITASAPYMFTPDLQGNVVTGQNVSITFTNGDTLTHSWTIIGRQGWVIPTSYTEAQLTALLNSSTYPLIFTTPAVNGPGQYTGSFAAPSTPGWYEFVCDQPGHFQLGMYGFIAFGEPLPANLTVTSANEGPGAAVFIIVGTIVSLTVIAIILGFIVGRRKGSVHEMPPERLGYPEPPRPSEPAPPPGAPPQGPLH